MESKRLYNKLISVTKIYKLNKYEGYFINFLIIMFFIFTFSVFIFTLFYLSKSNIDNIDKYMFEHQKNIWISQYRFLL